MNFLSNIFRKVKARIKPFSAAEVMNSRANLQSLAGAFAALRRRIERDQFFSTIRMNGRGCPKGVSRSMDGKFRHRRFNETRLARQVFLRRMSKMDRRILTMRNSCSATQWMADVMERRERRARVFGA